MTPSATSGGFPRAVFGTAVAMALAAGIAVSGESLGGGVVAFILVFFVAAAVIGLAAFLIGIPLTRVLESNGWERVWSYPVAGFLIGAATIFIIVEAIGLNRSWESRDLYPLLIGALPGALCGSLWWLFERSPALRREGTGGGGLSD